MSAVHVPDSPRMDHAGAAPTSAGVPADDDAAAAGAESDDWSAKCDERWAFQAHGASVSGDASKYRVAAGAELVTRFYFKTPSLTDVQMLEARALIDNKKIVHHWVLGAGHTQEALDGQVHGASGEWAMPFEGERPVAQGAPGATKVELPPDVGLRMPNGPDVVFDLEIHYSNVAGADAEEDATRLELCLTTTKRPNEATTHYLGRTEFSLPAHTQTDIASDCVPVPQFRPVHILAVTPHMHLMGEHSKVVLNRVSGEQVTLLDAAYAFQDQRSYVMPLEGSEPDVVLNPGDTLTSTCSFDNQTDEIISQGERTEEEMCEFAVLAWPAGILHNALGDVFGAVTDTGGLATSFCKEL